MEDYVIARHHALGWTRARWCARETHTHTHIHTHARIRRPGPLETLYGASLEIGPFLALSVSFVDLPERHIAFVVLSCVSSGCTWGNGRDSRAPSRGPSSGPDRSSLSLIGRSLLARTFRAASCHSAVVRYRGCRACPFRCPHRGEDSTRPGEAPTTMIVARLPRTGNEMKPLCLATGSKGTLVEVIQSRIRGYPVFREGSSSTCRQHPSR